MTASPHRLFVGGRVFTAGQASSLPLAVCVRGGRIEAVGTEDEIRELAGRSTEVHDLGGGLLLPGFQDAHAHPVSAGIEMLQCDLSGSRNAGDTLRRIGTYARTHPDEPWILGGGWTMDHFPGGTPTAAALDAVTGARPALLANRDHHGSWFNTAAARAAGITTGTADPADGRFERDEDGAPTGVAHEGAVALFDRILPPRDAELRLRGLRTAQQHLLSFGITGWQDALVGEGLGQPDGFDTYRAAYESGELVVRAALDLWWDRNDDLGQLGRLRARRDLIDRYGDAARLSAPNLKVMVDGIAENYTALLSEPYLDRHGRPTGNHGIPFVAADTLRDLTAAADAAGFGVHFHALGDAAVTASLDAIEHAQCEHGRSRHAHQLAHVQFIGRSDIPRFAALGAIANIQALWAARDEQFLALTEPFVAPSVVRQSYPFGSLARAGAVLAGGSDWPVTSPDPLEAAWVATHRTEPGDDAGEPLTSAAERLDLAQFFTAYTAGSALASGRGATTGRIAPGFAADLVVLDHDPFAGSVPVHEARAMSTWIDGQRVWAREG